MKISSIDLFASASCDLKCKYCYLPQDESVKQKHELLLNKFKNERFLDPVLNKCGNFNDITHIGLWGLEPTKILEVLSTRFDYLFKELPNLKCIAFSTNMQGSNDRIFNFIRKIGFDKKINIDIQVSLDGMPEVNDLTRGKNSGKNIISNMKSLVIGLDGVVKNQKNITFTLHSKTTITAEVLKIFDENKNLMVTNFTFLNDLYEELYKFRQPGLNISFGGGNVETPYEYSKEDGIRLFNLVRNLTELKQDGKFNNINVPFYPEISRIIQNSSEFNNKNFMFSCGASKSIGAIGIDPDFLPFCHTNYILKDDNKDINEFRNKFYERRTDGSNISKQQYLTSCYSDYPKIKLNQVICMCKELASCGLIDNIYLNSKYALPLAMFLISLSCPAEAFDTSSSPYITYMGKIKVHANGAFNYLLGEIIK